MLHEFWLYVILYYCFFNDSFTNNLEFIFNHICYYSLITNKLSFLKLT